MAKPRPFSWWVFRLLCMLLMCLVAVFISNEITMYTRYMGVYDLEESPVINQDTTVFGSVMANLPVLHDLPHTQVVQQMNIAAHSIDRVTDDLDIKLKAKHVKPAAEAVGEIDSAGRNGGFLVRSDSDNPGKRTTFPTELIQQHCGGAPRIYIYPLPIDLLPKYKMPLRSKDYQWQNIEKQVLSSMRLLPNIVKKPEDANWFMIPHISFALRRDDKDSDSTIQHFVRIMKYIETEFSYFNRSRGNDHFTVVAKARYAQLARWPYAKQLPVHMRNVVHITPAGELSNPEIVFVTRRDIVIMPLDRRFKPAQMIARPPIAERKYLFVFEGQVGDTTDPTNVKFADGLRYSLALDYLGAQDVIFRPYEQDKFHPDIYLDSRFCLMPRGYLAYTCRLTTLVGAGCVPVIIADDYPLPFWRVLDWTKFSVRISEADAKVEGRLREMLESISDEELERLETNLMSVQQHLLYHYPPRKGDATYMIVDALARLSQASALCMSTQPRVYKSSGGLKGSNKKIKGAKGKMNAHKGHD